ATAPVGRDAPRQMLRPFLRPHPLLLRRPASLHLALHRLRPHRARCRLHRRQRAAGLLVPLGRQRAAGLLVPLGQRATRGHLLLVFDGGQPRRALWLDPMPERLPTAAAAALMTLDLAFLRRRLPFGDHRKLIDKRLAETPA